MVPSATSQYLLDSLAKRKSVNWGLQEGKAMPQRKGTALFLQKKNLYLAYRQLLSWSAHETGTAHSFQTQDVLFLGWEGIWFSL